MFNKIIKSLTCGITSVTVARVTMTTLHALLYPVVRRSRQHLSNYKTEIIFFVKSKKCIFSTPSNIDVWDSAKHQHITDKGLTF